MKVVLADSLTKKKTTINLAAVRNVVRRIRWNRGAASNVNYSTIVQGASFNGKLTSETKILIRYLTVKMPWYDLVGSQRIEAYPNVTPGDNGFNALDVVLRCRRLSGHGVCLLLPLEPRFA
jgi:hypothetical protein